MWCSRGVRASDARLFPSAQRAIQAQMIYWTASGILCLSRSPRFSWLLFFNLRQFPRASTRLHKSFLNWIFCCRSCGGRFLMVSRLHGDFASLHPSLSCKQPETIAPRHKWRKDIKTREICLKCVMHFLCCCFCCPLFYENISPTPFVMLPSLIHLHVSFFKVEAKRRNRTRFMHRQFVMWEDRMGFLMAVGMMEKKKKKMTGARVEENYQNSWF